MKQRAPVFLDWFFRRHEPSSKKNSKIDKEEAREALLLMRGDPAFEGLYQEGLRVCRMNDNKTRKKRFYNLAQFFRQALFLEGAAAECGAWRGLSSFLLCGVAKGGDPGFKGEGYHIFDSFEGLPAPSAEDGLPEDKSAGVKGKFYGTLDDVQRALSSYPLIVYHAGWIPESFEGLPERLYKFVHIDLDLHRSTRAALDYFYPRLAPKGILVCDDYASPGWPGAKKAVDDYCREKNLSALALSTGQAALLGPYAVLA